MPMPIYSLVYIKIPLLIQMFMALKVYYNESQKSDASKQLAQFIQTHLVS